MGAGSPGLARVAASVPAEPSPAEVATKEEIQTRIKRCMDTRDFEGVLALCDDASRRGLSLDSEDHRHILASCLMVRRMSRHVETTAFNAYRFFHSTGTIPLEIFSMYVALRFAVTLKWR